MSEMTHEPLAQSEQMLRDAVAALDQADVSLLGAGLEPYRLVDWSEYSEGSNAFGNSYVAPGSLTSDTNQTTDTALDKTSGSVDPQDSVRIDPAYAQTEELRIELGRTVLAFKALYELPENALIVLDAHEEQLVDLYAGDRRLAKGEILCLDGQICFRVVELVGPMSSTQ
jgi:flagellar motor switch/type III secretory pathway protein FliN